MVSINGLVDIIQEISGVTLTRNYDLSAPKGVRGRNSDNTMILKLLNWEPKITLQEGLRKTYDWIDQQVKIS
jgi:nucleoside-diphosphate-sugar epimerase